MIEHEPVFTVGHSNRSGAALVALLRAHAVRMLVDIRAFPRSRRHPQFDRSMLEDMLNSREIHKYEQGDLFATGTPC